MEVLWRRCITRATKYFDKPIQPLLEATNNPYDTGIRSSVQLSITRGAATKKGKVAALKRRSVVKKTTKSGKDSSGGGSKESQQFKELIKKCLDAPTPVRYLKEKDRIREMEREKLGLISKDRQRELDMEKQMKKKLKEGEIVTETKEQLDPVALGIVDKDEIPSFEFTVEEGRRLAKEYSRMLARDLRARQAEESMRLKLKNDAIAALPPRLREAALVPDFTPFPANRHRAYLTPPIEGYSQKLKDAAKQLASKRFR